MPDAPAVTRTRSFSGSAKMSAASFIQSLRSSGSPVAERHSRDQDKASRIVRVAEGKRACPPKAQGQFVDSATSASIDMTSNAALAASALAEAQQSRRTVTRKP